MDYIAAKYLHLLGLAIWLGMIPFEIYTRKLIPRTDDQYERYKYIAFTNKLRFYQEYPAIFLVIGTGVWLVSHHGLGNLLQQEWFLFKLVCLCLLVSSEVYLTYEAYQQEKACKAAAESQEDARLTEESMVPMTVEAVTSIWFSGVMLAAISKSLPWLGVAIVAVIAMPPFIMELFYYKKLRSGKTDSPAAKMQS